MKKPIIQTAYMIVAYAAVAIGVLFGPTVHAQVFPFGPQYALVRDSIVQNENRTWNVLYDAPANTVASNLSLTVDANEALVGTAAYGGILFKVPETQFISGATRRLVLTNTSIRTVVSTQTVVIPAGLPVPYILDRGAISQDTATTWRIVYAVPVNAVANDFVLVVGTKGEVDGGVIVNDSMVFRVPITMFTRADTDALVLKNIVDGRLYRANGTVTQGPVPTPESDSTRYIGGLIVSFPPAQQTIKQTSAVIKANLHAVVDLPLVDSTYIWSKSGNPAENVERQFVKIPGGLTAGADTQGTLVFAGLTAGTTYTFVLKNNLTRTVSDPIKFTTPTTADGKAYVSYAGSIVDYVPSGGYEAPSGSSAAVDDISDKGIVPRCGRTPGPNVPETETVPCGYKDFLQLISNVIKYALILFGPIAAVMVIYSGFIIMIYGRIPDKTTEQMKVLKDAQAMLVKITIGVVIILSAWILIATITRELGVKESYTLLDLFTGN